MACVGEGEQPCAGNPALPAGDASDENACSVLRRAGLPPRLSLPAPPHLLLQPSELLSIRFTRRSSCRAPHPGSGQVLLSRCLSGTRLHVVFPACLLPGCSEVTRQALVCLRILCVTAQPPPAPWSPPVVSWGWGGVVADPSK